MITWNEISIRKDFEKCSHPKPHRSSNLMGFRLHTRKEFYIYRSGKNTYHTSNAATTMFQFIKKGGSFDISKNQNENIK